MSEMPSKRRFGNRPSEDRTDTRDTRETYGPFYNRENLTVISYQIPNEKFERDPVAYSKLGSSVF